MHANYVLKHADMDTLLQYMRDACHAIVMDPIIMEGVTDPVMFIHFTLGARQAGSQMVTDVTELKCCHIFNKETAQRLREEAANTHSGILNCPVCRLPVHIVHSLPSFGGAPMPVLPTRESVPACFEEARQGFAQLAADIAAAAASASAAAAAVVAPSSAAPAVVYDVDAPAYTPASPPASPPLAPNDRELEVDEDLDWEPLPFDRDLDDRDLDDRLFVQGVQIVARGGQ